MKTYPYREKLGQIVRETWVNYCKETGRIEKSSHIAPWSELDDWAREVDRQIGEAVADEIMGRVQHTIGQNINWYRKYADNFAKAGNYAMEEKSVEVVGLLMNILGELE